MARDRIRTVLLLGWFTRFTSVPMALLTGLWFLTQLFCGEGVVADVEMGGVAYIAHVDHNVECGDMTCVTWWSSV